MTRDSAHMFSNLHEAFVWLFLELIVPLLLIINSLVLLNHQQGARLLFVAVLLLLEGCWYTNLAAEYERNQYVWGPPCRLLASKTAEGKEPKQKRPYLATECHDVVEADKWRQQILREIGRKVMEIQNAGLGDHRWNLVLAHHCIGSMSRAHLLVGVVW